jgi:hypothetical protein
VFISSLNAYLALRKTKYPSKAMGILFVLEEGLETYSFGTGCRYFFKIAGNLFNSLGKTKYPSKAMGILFVLEEGLEPSSLAACDFESHVYTIPPLQRCGESVANYFNFD